MRKTVTSRTRRAAVKKATTLKKLIRRSLGCLSRRRAAGSTRGRERRHPPPVLEHRQIGVAHSTRLDLDLDIVSGQCIGVGELERHQILVSLLHHGPNLDRGGDGVGGGVGADAGGHDIPLMYSSFYFYFY